MTLTIRGVTFEQAVRILAAFEREEVHYVLIGSMAMAAHGLIRATRDIDFLVASDPDNVERIKGALRSVFNDDSVDEIGSGDLAGPYPVIRYGPPEGDFVIDLIARIGEGFTLENVESQELFVEGVRIQVATPRSLYLMKRDTLRPRDRVDAEDLRSEFHLDEGP